MTIGGGVRVAEVGAPEWVYDAQAQVADEVGGFDVEVARIGTLAASQPARVGGITA